MKALTKPCNENHDNTTKEVESVKKMKKARSSDLDTLKHPSLRRHERSEQPPSSSPGYMKSTICSEARKEQKQLAKSLNSTRIIAKAPSLKPTCPYSYCSLNSHKNDSNPPLKIFLRERRMALKKPKEDGEAITVLFVGEKANAASITALDGLYSECSDVELEEVIGEEILCLLDEEGVKKDNVGIQFLEELPSEESNELSQDEITNCPVQFSDSEPSVNDGYKEMVYYQLLQGYGCSDGEKSSGLDKKMTEASEAQNEETKDSPQSDDQTISPAQIGEESSITEFLSDDLEQPPSFGDSDSCKSLKTTVRSITQGETSSEFNPREPNYLELEPDAGAEKVDLRHQETDERRNAEEWMLDYALRKAVGQLAAARERKVGLLVEAFETITPPTKSHG